VRLRDPPRFPMIVGGSTSGRQDLNLRPPGPQPGALPDCATPRGRAKRATGIEPALKAWKAFVQPQHFARTPGGRIPVGRAAGDQECKCGGPDGPRPAPAQDDHAPAALSRKDGPGAATPPRQRPARADGRVLPSGSTPDDEALALQLHDPHVSPRGGQPRRSGDGLLRGRVDGDRREAQRRAGCISSASSARSWPHCALTTPRVDAVGGAPAGRAPRARRAHLECLFPGGLVYRKHGGLQNRNARFDSWVPRCRRTLDQAPPAVPRPQLPAPGHRAKPRPPPAPAILIHPRRWPAPPEVEIVRDRPTAAPRGHARGG
jgi:hypothetical protein